MLFLIIIFAKIRGHGWIWSLNLDRYWMQMCVIPQKPTPLLTKPRFLFCMHR